MFNGEEIYCYKRIEDDTINKKLESYRKNLSNKTRTITTSIKNISCIKNLYLPEHSLQGQDIPAYLIWDKNKKISIIIEIPEGIEIKELYNIKKDSYEKDKKIVIIKELEINGYLGILFSTKLYSQPKIKYNIIFRLKLDENEYCIIKEFDLFRPDIKLLKQPKRIDVNVTKNDKIVVNEKLIIKNNGEGTGVINLEISEDSELKKIDPNSIFEFNRKFWESVEKRLLLMKEEYEEYSNLIDDFLEIKDEVPQFNELWVKKIEKIFDSLYNAFEDNSEFYDDFGTAIFSSYIKNLTIMTEVESFVNYLKSIYLGKVVFFDSIKVIKLTKDYKKLKARLGVMDLAYNNYDPIIISDIEIKCNKECEIPIYTLFSLIEDPKGGQ